MVCSTIGGWIRIINSWLADFAQRCCGIAHGLGVSEAVIGLTLVAFGTSLPELTISIISALRKHAEVAVGNILDGGLAVLKAASCLSLM
ncbi:hypothetical protein [Paraglaciecola sp. T6c]|uniref:hypothetical protein n=1 Tax=Pseudoalteromonas atlantica (strain T6c / ATCC BAA-1087) TaxID=3042615 RepID=UPI0034647A8C